MPASTDNGHSALNDVPSFISARAANTLISEDRPTRIQAETLLVLNSLLDELLLVILSSARSLATDRIKSDGMLRVFNNNLLAKDAVLEAELELRSYVEGKRAEGAKVPLGLMATSRLDGSDGFPVQSAYKALRTRCQYYSTLGDCQDDSAAKDQNIMSSDGRPIATVTPGVAIYVTALLEFVGEHILQNVSRVIERDNSDEASLYDLRAAITEDEQLNPLYNKLSIRQEVARRIDILEARRRKITEDGASRGLRSDARVVKPWHVPTEGDFDEAAAPNLFSAKRASIQQQPRSDNGFSTASSSSRHGHAASSSIGHTDSLRGSMSTLHTSSSLANHSTDANGVISPGGSMRKQNGARSSIGLGNAGARPDGGANNTGSVGRRQSSERSWSGVFGNMKRRNSFKQGSDVAANPGRLLLPTDANSTSASQVDSALDPDDDFEALMLSGQTMKVSLTPNRLHTIEVAKKGGNSGAEVGSVRRRPGTAGLRDDPTSPAGTFGRGPSPSPTHASQISTGGEGLSSNAVASAERTSTSSATLSDAAFSQPSSRATLQTAMRPERRTAAPPPSSYRSPSPALIGKHNLLSRDVPEEEAVSAAPSSTAASRRLTPRLQPRDDEMERSSSTAKDLVDLFKSTPPSATQERFSNFGSDTSSLTDNTTKKSAMSERVRTLFGRKSSSSTGHHSPSSPQQKAFRMHQRADTKASLEGSQDTYITSSTTNSLEQSRSLVSPNEVPFNRAAASRSSTSTSEHPAVSADAALEVKPTPDVTVIEPENAPTSHGPNGLGLGVASVTGVAGAAGAIAAARTASYGSRSTSYASQTPSAAEGVAQEDALPDDGSTTSKTKTAEELVSRKVPWGYKRNSTSTSTMIERNGTPTSDRRRSVGYQSSNGHGVLPVRGHPNAPSSDNGHGPANAATVSPTSATADEGGAPPTSASSVRATNAPTAWSGPGSTTGSQVMIRRGSFGTRPSTANQPRRPSTHLETIQLLAELERAMRNCHSVDECRALVRKAMHSDGVPLSPSGSRDNGITDENAVQSDASKTEVIAGNAIAATSGGTLAGATVAAGAAAAVVASSEAGKNRSNLTINEVEDRQTRGLDPNPNVALSQPPTEDQVTSLDKVEQGLVVAWLLGGDDGPDSQHDIQLIDAGAGKKQEQLVKKSTVVPAAEANGSGTNAAADEAAGRHASLDSHMSRGDVHGLASSSVVSLQSNYKDAQDEVTVD
ncbi:uncharacterized protein UTRI_04359 [Ustilago trichophora]|uniref:Uncharacterized protein n=1 Tax=Ustilago trichophora TaxID=86804 RepID=A0A5C3ERH9_9BASI|nr:uncharacterized protein UTRI_04359 [Ustilago trichophora]